MLVVEGILRTEVARQTKRQVVAGGGRKCANFEYDVSENCRSSLAFGSGVWYAEFSTNFCLGDCGREIYDYYTKCDGVTGENNAAVLDFLCATPTINGVTGTQCISKLSTIRAFEEAVKKQCTFQGPENDCNPTCSATINTQNRALGCCLYTYAGLREGTLFANYLFKSCSADVTVCDGGFSNQLIPLPLTYGYDASGSGSGSSSSDDFFSTGYDSCQDEDVSINQVPVPCREFIQTDLILLRAYSQPEAFVSSFCRGPCAKPVYEYFKKCNKDLKAPALDFLCTSDPKSGADCARIISSTTFDSAFKEKGVCNATDVCSTDCSTALKDIKKNFGCCLYTYFAVFGNTTAADEILRNRCDIDTPGLCQIGALSGDVINAPGREKDDAAGSEEKDGSNTSAMKASTFLVFATLLLGAFS